MKKYIIYSDSTMTAINMFSGESVLSYTIRLFLKLHSDDIQDVDKCLNSIRLKLSREFPEVNDNFIWNRKYVNSIYTSSACLKLINENIQKKELELMEIEKKKNIYKKKAKIIKNINEKNRLYTSHYNSLKSGYIKCLSVLNKFSRSKHVPNIPNIKKIVKLFSDLSTICKAAKNPKSLVYSLIHYMFPDLFGKDNRFIYYRIKPKKRTLKQLSPFKMNLIKILVEDRFFHNKIITYTWERIRIVLDRIFDNMASINQVDTMYKLKPLYKIKIKNENDKAFIKEIVSECITTQELVEKVLKRLFVDIFKDGSYTSYRHDSDDNEYIPLDKIKLEIVHSIVDPCIYAPKHMSYLICREMINKYFENPTHIIGKNIQECVEIAKKSI
ncbi:abundant component of virosome [Yokapox virus]|uniref:Abundant component of virosome n=1 Tax=Yokapox virus TaxID=1076255 RepID=G3EIB7_9POXV|nr:abundant component of virosome [Yokapox virus]AEN03628.1 abundant component of virosome [Yokapox virus]